MSRKNMIECLNLHDNKKLIPKNRLRFRIGVYGIIANEGKILLVNVRSTGKYFFPGGGVKKGESLADALNREILEEAGIEVEIEKMLMFGEKFFYHDVLDKAYQHYYCFYVCKPKTFYLLKAEGENIEKPRWVDINSVKKEDFPYPSGDAFEMFLKIGIK